ncbi:MAG TPA: hypothetical protein VMW11_01630 [Candidatus Dormibacteraeota bacterium]|nr:hypothetical protein [Candidatus Dormibacteraeota bacterium]
MGDQTVLLITVALLTVYVVGVGGSTAAAIGTREAWRRRVRSGPRPDLAASEVVLDAPSLPPEVRALRVAGWAAFPFALALAVFADRHYPWVAPVAVLVMVALNAYYFTAVQGLGERLTLSADGFRLGARAVRWIHVTDLTGAHMGAFRGMRMSEAGEWQDPKVVPNVVFYRLNRALVHPRKSIMARFGRLSYFDGMIRNVFGVTTEQLLRAMRDRQRLALEAEGPPIRRPRPGEVRPLKNPEA